MKLKIHNGFIKDEDDCILGTISEELLPGQTNEVETTIEAGSEALKAILDFVSKVNSGSFKPRTAVKEFEKIIEKYELKPIAA